MTSLINAHPPVPEVFTASASGDVDESVRGGIGHLSRVFGTAPVSVAEGVERLRVLQERVVVGNRFGIPAIVHGECPGHDRRLTTTHVLRHLGE